MKNEISDDLLLKFLDGQCSASEIDRIKSWTIQDPSNEAYLSKISKIHQVSTSYPMSINPDTENQFESFKKKAGIKGGTRVIDLNVNKRSEYRFKLIAAVVIFGLVSFLSMILMNNDYSFSENNDLVVSTKASEQNQVTLPDGTTVYLNVDSKLVYPAEFAIDKRTVTLIGEAFFDVARNESKPFIINTGGTNTTVLGTSFNIKAYPDNPNVHVTVATGKVRIADEAEKYEVFLEPGLRGTYNGQSLTKDSVDVASIMGWRYGQLIFDNVDMEEVAAAIQRWYNVSFFYDHDMIGQCQLSSNFDNATLEETLEIIALTFGAEFTLSDGEAKLEGGSCN